MLPRFGKIESKELKPIPYTECHAKTEGNGKHGITVLEHCVHVGSVAIALASTLPKSVQTMLSGLNIGLIASLHDIGKVSVGYQKKYFSTKLSEYDSNSSLGSSFLTEESTEHSSIGAATINHLLGVKNSHLSQIIAIHHGWIKHIQMNHDVEIYGTVSWSLERDKLVRNLEKIFSGSILEENNKIGEAVKILEGLVCVADWIGSNQYVFNLSLSGYSFSEIQKVAKKAVANCGFVSNGYKDGLSFKDLFGFEPRPSQVQFIESIEKPGLYILEAPMGDGKTEAALYAAYKLMVKGVNSGIYFALPTKLTSDSIYARVKPFIKKTTGCDYVRLAHGSSWLYQGLGGAFDFGASWFNSSKRALLSPFAVGTIDQSLLSVLNVKHSFVRLFGLAGKVVILDEVHSYDMYTGMLLNVLVERLLQIGCTVIILSATLTKTRRKSLCENIKPTIPFFNNEDNYPLMTCFNGTDWNSKSLNAPPDKDINILLRNWSDYEVVDNAVENAKNGACVVCIANTVDKAQKWYRLIREKLSGSNIKIGLLHSRFPASRRREIESEWVTILGGGSKNRPHGCILVSTQIVEQSVDIDADVIFSELAPMDMLLQRIGRLWRHKRDIRPVNKPQFIIVSKSPNKNSSVERIKTDLGWANSKVYEPYVLVRTHHVIKRFSKISIPSQIRSLIEATYSAQEDKGSMLILKQELDDNNKKRRDKALVSTDGYVGTKPLNDDDSVFTRYIETQPKTVLLLRSLVVKDKTLYLETMNGNSQEISNISKTDFATARMLNDSSVSLQINLLTEHLISDMICDERISKCFSEPPIVLIVTSDASLVGADFSKTKLSYTDEYGITKEKE